MSAKKAAKKTKTKTSPPGLKPAVAGKKKAAKVAAVEPVDGDDEAPLDGEGGDGGSDEDREHKDDPVLDRRIIEGMLADRKVLLAELAKEGYTQGFVLRRAAELGLSDALLRQVRGVAADLAGDRPGRRPMPTTLGARTCLSCDRVFLSTGAGNRLCMRCRGGDAGLAGL